MFRLFKNYLKQKYACGKIQCMTGGKWKYTIRSFLHSAGSSIILRWAVNTYIISLQQELKNKRYNQ